MIHDLKRYPAYKDSGVPWLGEVPEHWEKRPLKRWVRMNAEVLPETTAPNHEFCYLDIGSVGTGVLTQKPQRLRFGAAPSRARRVVYKGDTIVSTVRTYLKAIYFANGEPDELVCSTGFAVLTPRIGTLPKFVSYLAQSNPFTDRVTAYSVGIAYPAIAETRLGSFHVAVPPLPEQAAIVRFLDYVDPRIRRYIRAKQKLINLLEEQKQASIHRAVTRGLDPNVRLKPSGVDWLGDVPEHWEVVPLRWYISIGSGDFIETERVCNEATQERPYPVIGGNGVMGYASTSNSDETTIVIGRVGALCGNVHLVSMSAWITDNALRVSRIKGFDPDYLATQMRAMNLNRLANANAQPLVTGGMIKSQRVVKPSIEAQQTLVTRLRALLEPMEAAITKAQREISLLREYRTRLIADVVTGKLDVREAAAKLPDEAGETEPLEEAEGFAEGEESNGADFEGAEEVAEA
jgi:type I restriction enzyme S subunit